MEVQQINNVPQLANAFRITKDKEQFILDFAFTNETKTVLTDEDVQKISSIFVQKDFLKLICDKINEVIAEE